jgi:hypothetical protein
MKTTHSDNILSAIEDAERLVPWARDNDIIVQAGGHLSKVVARSLRGHVPAECAFGTPLLRQTDTSLHAASLLSAVLDWKLTVDTKCCFCTAERVSRNRLTVLAGASAVWLHICDHCKPIMDETFSGLHWDTWEDADSLDAD